MTGIRSHVLAIGLAAAALAFAAPPATAADLGGPSYKDKVPFIPPSPTQWAGWYLGGHLGGAFDFDDAFIGGAHLGHNWQTGRWVYGLEGDVSFASDINYLASIRGRLGIASHQWFLYGTAGVAFIETERDFVSFAGVPFSADQSETGFVGGGGLEYLVSDTVSLGVEALYYTFDDDLPSGAFSGDDDLDFVVVRGRLTWHFGGRR